MSPDTVVFDVGNVLIHWDPRHLFRKLLPGEAEVEDFLGNVATPDWNVEQDRGRGWDEAVAELAGKHPQHEPLIRAYRERWQETVPGAIEGSVAILEKLRSQGVPLYAITNFSAEKWAESVLRFPFLARFRDVVVSAHERLIKPDAAIYELFLKRNGLAAEKCVFIDDSLNNVAGARAAGMHALHFAGPEMLAADLRDIGFPV